MKKVYENQKLVIGISIRTDNDECLKTMPELWGRFFKEGILEKIPNKVNRTIFAVYDEYEGDYTKPYTYTVGCEVSTLEEVPPDMVGKVVPASNYAIFKTEGQFPESLGKVWYSIWNSNLKRAYTVDFEVYPPDFDPIKNPLVKVFIAL